MYRQSSSRNQRNKGFKVKHALQIILLVAICFWLIYQVKHSYDKKKDFEDNDARNSQHIRANNEILKLGRKDPHPQVKEPSKKYEKHDEEADEDIEIDIKAEEKEDEDKGGGDDEVEEKKSRENVFADKDGKIETESSEDNFDNDRVTKNTHEAREEQYKADDASSAVTNEGQTFSSESESSITQNQTNTLGNENRGSNTVESIIGQNITDSKVLEEETAGNVTSSMVNPEKGSEVLNSTSQGRIIHNITVTESTDKLKLSNDTAEVDTELHNLLNGTEISILDLSQAQNDTDKGKGSAAGSNIQTVSVEHDNISSIDMVNSRSDSNTTDTISTGYVESNLVEFSNFSSNQIALEHTAPSNASAKTKDASEINVIGENKNSNQTEKSDLSTRAYGNHGGSDSSVSENAGKIQNGTFDSIIMEDKLPQLDLETLPNLRMEASSSEVVADE